MSVLGDVRERLAFLAGLALLLVLPACGGGGGGGGDQGSNDGSAAPQQKPASQGQGGGSTAQGAVRVDDPDDGGETSTAPGTAAQSGTWTVGDAGEVEFGVENGALSLVEVRPSPGWTERLEERGSDEIEVDFFRDNVEWQFTADTDAGGLDVDTDQTINGAQAGVYRVGDAGEVEFRPEGGALALGDVSENPGWTSRVVEQSPEEIEVDFGRGNARQQFTAELDDGQLQVSVDQQVVDTALN